MRVCEVVQERMRVCDMIACVWCCDMIGTRPHILVGI